MLPVSSASGTWTDPLTALFTATTSVCVTGLVVVDTYAHWSLFGQVVILLLIQLGGLGIAPRFQLRQTGRDAGGKEAHARGRLSGGQRRYVLPCVRPGGALQQKPDCL